MKKKLLLSCCLLQGILSISQSVTKYVDPFIGTAAHGHTYPGATVPFGMVQLSPDNGTEGRDWCSGYNYADSVIVGFSHTHLSGTGVGDMADVSVLPAVGENPTAAKLFSNFSHESEAASPGYYKVDLKKYNIQAELTAGLRYGVHRYTFPASEKAMIRFDLGFAINSDKPTETNFTRINDSTFAGYRFSTGWAKNQKVYFVVHLSKPVQKLVLFTNEQEAAATEATSPKTVACLMFSTKQGEQVEMKVALSTANIEGAMAVINKTNDLNFDRTLEMAKQSWEKELSKIAIETNEQQKKIFYTALYHSFLAPTIFNDEQGNYKTISGAIGNSTEPVYSTHSLWDVFRAQSPLFTLIQTNRVTDIINSYLKFYKQYGLLPVWDLGFNETNTMTGYHAVPIIADAINKNIQGFDVDLAYEAMKKSGMQDIRSTDVYKKYGYVPQDKHAHSVTMTLEYAFDDWCIAQVAKKLGKTDDYNLFMKRSASWKQLFDKSIGFARAKNSDGKWVEPFDPYASDGGGKAMFTEGNSWQHSWFVPQDVKGLIDAHGGDKKFLSKLDSLFSVSSAMTGDDIPEDISGMMGQYAQGNEPDHHVAYLYNYAGAPYKTAEKINQITSELYTDKPDGLCGNEDCGQMSAWYVLSAVGFYPVNAADGRYVFGRPLFDKATLSLADGKKFTVRTINNSAKNLYIQSVALNGKTYTRSYITHQDIIKGGELVTYNG